MDSFIAKKKIFDCAGGCCPMCLWRLVEPTGLADDVEEVRRVCQAAALGLDVFEEPLGQDLDHGLGSKLVHGVVLPM